MPEPLWLTPPKPTPTPRPFNQDWVPPTGLDERLGQLDRIACGAHAGTRIRPNWLPPSPPFATQLREPSSLLGPASSEALWRAPARRPGLPRFPNLTLLGVGQFECEHDQQGLLQFQIPVYRHEVFHTALLEAGVAMDPHRGSHPACEFVLLNWFDPGEFLMGPVKNPVRFSLPYLVARTPTVQAVWAYVARNLPQHAQVLEPDPASFKAALRPVEMVTWYDCVEFCARVGLSLLNDAEWEYGCRGGSLSAFCFGQQQKRLDEFAWFNKNADGETHEVATLKPNAFGLYDMHGNVWEWCLDEWSGGNAWDPFSWEPPSIDPDAIIQVQLADENGPFDLLAARERRPDPTAARRNLPSSALTRETTPHHSNLTVAQADSDFAPGGEQRPRPTPTTMPSRGQSAAGDAGSRTISSERPTSPPTPPDPSATTHAASDAVEEDPPAWPLGPEPVRMTTRGCSYFRSGRFRLGAPGHRRVADTGFRTRG